MPYQRTGRRPRPTEPPTGYEGNYDSTHGGRKRYEVHLTRRPRPSGLPPGNDTGLPLYDAKYVLESPAALVVRTEASTGSNADLALSAGRGEQNEAEAGSRRGRTAESSSSRQQDSRSTTGNDPLRHYGRWIPAEYHLFKRLPRTGYWTCCGNKFNFATHCASFDARTKQREVDYIHDVLERQDRRRKETAIEFRARWEAEGGDHSQEYSHQEQTRRTESSSTRVTIGTGLPVVANRRAEPLSRPFMRRKWLEQIAHNNGQTSGAAADLIDASTTGEKSASSFLRNQLTVKEENVRSVVKLVLSEARVNAFVVISSLEGLLCVATEGLGFPRVSFKDQSDGMTVETAGTHVGFNVCSKQAVLQNSGVLNKRHPKNAISLTSSMADGESIDPFPVAENGRQPGQASSTPLAYSKTAWNTEGHDGEASACDGTNQARKRREKSGAFLCISLGALPAIVDCLSEHAGHAQVEALGMELLRVFASDSTTRDTIKGNRDIATVCAARMHRRRNSRGRSSSAGTADAKTSRNGCAPAASQPDVVEGRKTTSLSSTNSFTGIFHHDGETDHHLTSSEASEISTAIASTSITSSAWQSNNRSSAASVIPSTKASTASSVRTGEQRIRGAVDGSIASSNASESAASGLEVSESTRTGRGGTEQVGLVSPPLEAGENDSIVSDGSVCSAATVMFVLTAVLQNSPACQQSVLQQGGIAAALDWLMDSSGESRDHGDGTRLCQSCLEVVEHLAQSSIGRMSAIREGAVEAALSTMEIFRSDSGVLVAAMGLLMVTSESPTGRRRILKANGESVVFSAMQRLVGEVGLQVKGADMLQTLIKEEPQARREFDEIKGGWQWLCQGTSEGNALLRYAPGEKHIAGWTISQEERTTTTQALKEAERVASNWTAHKLAIFMRRDRKGFALQLTGSASDHYFNVVSEAGLLPYCWEDVDEWQRRTRRYEEDHHIRINNITRRRVARHLAASGSSFSTPITAD